MKLIGRRSCVSKQMVQSVETLNGVVVMEVTIDSDGEFVGDPKPHGEYSEQLWNHISEETKAEVVALIHTTF